ncbi:MAG: HAD family hydrolase [Candidatus Limnocylindrales bacterium]
MSKAVPPAYGFTAAIFDMDGVVTNTTGLHAAAWKEVFDGLLRRRAGEGKPYHEFDAQAEYRTLVDGKPRREGVRAFLQARQIELTDAEQEALAARKDGVFERCLRDQGVQTFASSIDLIQGLRERGVKTGVVTSSRHGRDILKAAGLDSLFDVRLDGIDLEQLSLKGKPEPDMFLKSAELFGATPGRCLVFEDAVAGVQAGRDGEFGYVVGVDRVGHGHADALRDHGADIVVTDLAALLGE